MNQRERVTTVTDTDLTPGLLRDLFPDGAIPYHNIFYYGGDFESDVIMETPDGLYYEFEFKNNYADYRLDFTKCIGRMKTSDSRRVRKPGDTRTFKHDLVKNGNTGCSGFYFVTPQGVLNETQVPEYCGLIEMDRNLFGEVYINVLKKAPSLPGAMRRTPQLFTGEYMMK